MLAVYPPLRLISGVHRDREERPITSIAIAYNLFLSSSSQAAIRICTLSPHHHLFIYPFFSVSVCHFDLFFLQIYRGGGAEMVLKARLETRKVKDTISDFLQRHLGPLIQPFK